MGWWADGAKGVCRAVKLLCRTLLWWIHVIMHSSKSRECTTSPENPKVNCGLGVMIQCRFISCNKRPTWWGYWPRGRLYTWGRAVLCLVAQLCLTLCHPLDCSPPGSSVHGILQARVLAWVACLPLRGLPDPGIKPRSPALQVHSLPSEPPGGGGTWEISVPSGSWNCSEK